MVDYFISDTHFRHSKILRYDGRPFSSIEEHDETIIQNWNSVVRKTDVVYHLGDFAFGPKDIQEKILKRLNGQIRLIRGNHDLKKPPHGFQWVKDIAVVKVGGKKLALCHYPFACPPRCFVHLHGHSHKNLPHRLISEEYARIPSYNLYLGFWNWSPVALEQILEVEIPPRK